MEDRRTSPLHGRRVGKPLSGRQKELVATLLPRLAVDVSRKIDIAALFGRAHPPLCEARGRGTTRSVVEGAAGASMPDESKRDDDNRWGDTEDAAAPSTVLRTVPLPCFAGEDARVHLEVGFGAGEHLVAEAERERGVGFIGCEPFLNGMAHALAKIADGQLDNVRLHLGDAGEVIERLPRGSLDRVSILYPDPWPKRRQRKRRFIDDAMLERLAGVLKPDAELRFATDIDDLCGWTLACLARSQAFAWTAERAADWQKPWDCWAGTRYERKAIEEGRRPCYITARRR